MHGDCTKALPRLSSYTRAMRNSLSPLMWIVSLAAVVGFACLAGCGGTDNTPDPSAPLRIGLEAAYPPFETKTSAGEFEGFDIDLVRRIGKELGREVEIQDLQFDTLLLKLAAGDLDLVCSGLSFTEERAKKVDFSKPYIHLPMGVLLSKEKAGDIASADGLNQEGVQIVVQRGTTGAKKAHARFPKASIREYDTSNDAANELVIGRANAFVYDVITIFDWHRRHPDATRVLQESLGAEQYCIAFRKGSDLRASVDAFLTAPANRAWFDAQEAKWFDEEQRALFVR